MSQPNNLEMIPCVKCRGDMPLLRKEKFGYDFCVNCSNVAPKRGVSFSLGEGEDTWDETIIMDDNQFKLYSNTEKALNKK